MSTPEVTTPAAEPVVSPATPAVEAPKSIATRRSEIRDKLAKPADATPPPAAAETDKPAETPPVVAKAKGAEDDEISALIQEDRRLKTDRGKLETERAAFDAERKEYAQDVELVKAARAAKANGDRVGILRAIYGEDDLNELFWELAKIYENGDATKIDPDKLATAAAEKVEAKRKADAEAAAAKEREETEKAQADVKAARAEYVQVCDQVYNASADKFPGVARLFKVLGDDAGEAVARRILRKWDENWAKNKTSLTPAEALAVVNADLVAADPAPEPVSKPSTTVTQQWRGDVGRPAAETGPMTLEQKRKAIREKLANGSPR